MEWSFNQFTIIVFINKATPKLLNRQITDTDN